MFKEIKRKVFRREQISTGSASNMLRINSWGGMSRGRVDHSKSVPHTPLIEKEIAMKDSTVDKTKGTLHEMKGNIKETVGKVTNNPELETAGKDEKRSGQVQKKVGEVEKVFGK